ncbi:Prolyl 3-hydroxylase 1 [Triplophysa tibetana]|uniref:Prolyl 3-hydroxylase 1 n=1 Tax=Triplophysa tibetana TaxID=1572043 RepID=A0A5A9NEF7_9TELE|nr:Prolyl 3-hydroxylase 1 [Triplophysa tibetana]
MWSALSLIINLSILHFTFSENQITGILEPHDLLFDNAVEAYYKQDWLAVILNMEKALRNKGTVRKVQTQCRLSCADRDAFGDPFPGLGVPIPGAGPVEDLAFFQRILKRAECVNACESEKLGPPTLHKVSETVELEFKKRTPYNYLQVAYFKINKLDKAVAAANTFFIANPDHVEMKQNLEYYSLMAGVQQTDFKDLEEKPHMTEFIEGKMHYSMEKFAPAIEHFEAAVEEYFTAYEECRVLCEGAFSYDNYMEYNADLFQAMTGEKYEQAIECAKTYLLFHPEDEVMVQNLAYYSAVLGEDKAANISAREIVKQYINRSVLEKELLYFGYEIFGKTFVDPDTWTPENIMPKKLRDKQKADKETAARITEEIGNLMKEIETLVEEKSKESFDIGRTVIDEIISAPTSASNSLPFDDITISMTSTALNGSQRVVLDVFYYKYKILQTAALQGDEYKAKPSPLSQNEMFQELTVLKALQFGREGVVPLKSAQGFFNLTEKIRKVLESHFVLHSPLYFSSSNLVCRSVVEGKQEGHENGCLLVSELNECIKDPSAFSHGDYRYATHRTPDALWAVVKPQCGRVVAFGAGQENLHGVTSLTKGQRCAVAIRFTLDPHNSEKASILSQFVSMQFDRLQAEELLKTLSNPATPDIQKTDDNNETKTSEPEVVVKPADTPEQDDKTNKPAETSKTTDEQNTKAAEKKTNNKVDKKSEKPKAKASKKPAKTEDQTKAKADQTKSTATEKKKSITTNKTKPKTTDKKEKPPAKKKATGKNTTKDQKTKSKSTEPQNSKAEEDKDEL